MGGQVELEFLRRQLEKVKTGRGAGNDGGGEPPVEARLAKLEAAVESLTKHYATGEAVARLEGKLDAAAERLDGKYDVLVERLNGIENRMLTKGEAAIYTMATLLAVLGAGWWVVQQYLAPILAALP